MELSREYPEFFVELVQHNDLEQVAKLEAESFPSDEAATVQSIEYRILNASTLFYKLSDLKGNLIGFINGTCISGLELKHECMFSNDPSGSTLVMHSVTISNVIRRKGVGTAFLKKYLELIQTKVKFVKNLLLLSKAYLLKFYTNCGFSIVGLSNVVHGKDNWFEMLYSIPQKVYVHQLQIDAFTKEMYKGNPAAIVFEQRSENWMQKVANENNLAETAFLNGNSDLEEIQFSCHNFCDRFTPTIEVALCGHATLASAHALYESNRYPKNKLIRFKNMSNCILTAQGKEDGTIELNFPSTPPMHLDHPSAYEIQYITTGLHVRIESIRFIGKTMYDYFIEITQDSFSKLGNDIDLNAIAALGGRGVIVTCLGGKWRYDGNEQIVLPSPMIQKGTDDERPELITEDHRYDFLSRFFCPCVGINEDPVTGSAHCALAPYWFSIFESKHTSSSSRIPSLTGYQASKRGGVVNVLLVPQLEDDNTDQPTNEDRVILTGDCVITIESKIIVDE